MTVRLYNCSSAPDVLGKSYTLVQEVTATIKGAMDVDQPTLLLNYSSMDFNYFYIAETGRYYNILSRNLEEGKHIRLTGQSDPLESFRSQIEGLPVLAVRCEDSSYRSADIADNNVPIESDLQLDKIVGDTVIGAGAGMVVIGVI